MREEGDAAGPGIGEGSVPGGGFGGSDAFGPGNGYGAANGFGNGNGAGAANGNGFGNGNGAANGNGFGAWAGNGNGNGAANGNGFGNGNGAGNGNGFGNGNGAGAANGNGFGNGNGTWGGNGNGNGGSNGNSNGNSNGCRRYSAIYKAPPMPGLVWYYFIVSTNSITRYYGNNERSLGGVGLTTFSPPASYQITVYEESAVPNWWKEGMVYQIFVDRFSRGKDWKERFFNASERKRDVGPTRLLQTDWRDAPFLYKDDRGWVTRWPFFGGTLEGVREKLGYLRSLGVTIIYFNPIFEAASNHKYDTADYMSIDPGYGDEESFKGLLDEAAGYGIHVMLDGVFSHTGADSKYFNKYGNYPTVGAWQSADSPYRSWYRFNHDAEGYECWWGVADLPNVEENDPSYKEYIWGAPDSVIRHWLKAGAMGWRLDVADELPDEFIRNIKTAIKETTPEGVLLGEVWEDASNKRSYGMMREYLLGKELDSTMNYPFKAWCVDFALNRISPADVHSRVMNIYENYPREHFFSCLNLIGSHDSVRALTALGEPPDESHMTEWQKQVWRLDAAKRETAKRRLKLLSLWQMAFPGVPSIYYGDEVGMEGFSDPYNRAAFPWGDEDKELLGWYYIICNLRAEYGIFRSGEFVSYGGYADTYAFCRFDESERAVVLLNASGTRHEDISLWLSDDETLCLELLSGAVLEPERAGADEDEDGGQAGKAKPDAFLRGAMKYRQGLGGQGQPASRDMGGQGRPASRGDASGGLQGAAQGHASGASQCAAARIVKVRVGPGESRIVYMKRVRPGALAMKGAQRAAGILCHITSLPSEYGCGGFGAEAYSFCDYLEAAGQKIWQILPLNPAGAAYSPYSSCSAFAGNELLIDPGALARDGLLSPDDLPPGAAGALKRPDAGTGVNKAAGAGASGQATASGGAAGAEGAIAADFEKAARVKLPLYRKAYAAFDQKDKGFKEFCASAGAWLEDYCLYRALSAHFGEAPWQEWPEAIRGREPGALQECRERHAEEIGFYRFLQYKFFTQWKALKAYANAKGITVLGDMPIYVAPHSCDTWVNREIFLLDGEGRPCKTGGVPPDFFSEDGQNWKNPVFDWGKNKAGGYAWWIERFRRNLQLYDYLRLDHFRGFDACWEIPGEDSSAKNGCWIKGPGKALFEAVEAALGPLPFLAEDLGYITPNVNDLKNTFAWPGLKVYQFHADEMDLGDAYSPEAPPPHSESMRVYYTGTHDNDTLAGWLAEGAEDTAEMIAAAGAVAASAAEPGAAGTAHAAEPGAAGTAAVPENGTASAGDAASAAIGSAPAVGAGAERPAKRAGDAVQDSAIRERCAEIIEAIYASKAMWAILPLQDVWFLDSGSRMNTPGTVEGNWIWMAGRQAFTAESAAWLKELAKKCWRQ
jgi:4-alpha-glucanotransferase/glycosidase